MALSSNVYEIWPGAIDQRVIDQHGSIENGSGGGGMEARLTKLESSVEHIQSDVKEIKQDIRDIKKDAKEDFRINFGALIVVALGLALLLAKGFHWL